MPILDHKQCYHGIVRKLSREEVSTWDRKWFARLSWWLSWDENQLSPIKISLSWDTEIIITRQERNIIHSVVSNVNMTKLHNSVSRLSGPFERALEWQFCGTKSRECLLTLSWAKNVITFKYLWRLLQFSIGEKLRFGHLLSSVLIE